ncbi:hypothetical protein GCM10027435_12660 [Haloparvum alkalitolerans]
MLTVSEISSVSYLETIQPDWDDLPLTCELLELRRREPSDDLRTLALNRGGVGSRKVQHVTRLLHLLELLEDDELTDRGRWLAEAYEPAMQQSRPRATLGIGVKDTLSHREQILLWMVIYHEHRLPMLAVLHQLSVESVPVAQDSPAAQRLAERIDHLYPGVDSESSWVPRAKVHYKWLVHMGFAKVRSNSYILTDMGDSIFEQVETECPDQWDTIQIHTGPTLSDFS